MRIIFSHPRDNLLETATLELRQGVLVDAATGLDQLFDWDPSNPLMIVGTTIEIVMDHASAVAVGLAVPWIHSTVDVAGKVQRNATDSWGAPTVDETWAIPAVNNRGLYTAPWLDLTNNANNDYPALRWTRYLITTNGEPITIGESFLGSTFRSLSSHLGHGTGRFGRRGDSVLHTTHGGIDLAYERSVGRKYLSGTIWVDDDDKALIEAWHDAARGSARPFMLVPDERVDDAWVARFAADELEFRPIGGSDGWEVDLSFVQVSPSLAWIDPDA